MPVTNAGTLPPPFDPSLSPLRYDFSGDQPWLAGVAVSCERCGFGETLDEGASVGSGVHGERGLQTAYHFVYKDGSHSGWGYGVFVCPCCKKHLRFKRELTVSEASA